jgi:5-methylcytosine-specific restriction protein A
MECKAAGRVTAATMVDHIIPHRGDQKLFWDSEHNWQSGCKLCHDRKTAREDGGFGNPRNLGKADYGCSVDGTPLDPRHRWNA